MNFLALVQDLARQSGTLAGGTTISAVTGVSGRADKLVDWTIKAWKDIQRQRLWQWLRVDFDHTLLESTNRYTAASMNLTRFRNWVEDTNYFRAMTLYDPGIGQSDEQELRQISYEAWKLAYGRGSHDPDRPVHWAISPTNEFLVGPTPDQEYALLGEYRKSAQVLAANSDTPEAPEDYHEIIVYRAIQLMAESDESVPTLQMANIEYTRLFSDMVNDPACLPAVSVHGDGPMA